MAKKTPEPKTSGTAKNPKAGTNPKTKKQTCIDMLQRSKGASLAELQKATSWQPHSVRGFLSGTVKKLPGVMLMTDVDGGGTRRYRIESGKRS